MLIRTVLLVALSVTVMIAAGCSSSSPVGPSAWTRGTATFVGAGDIGECTHAGTEATARLLDGIAGTVFTAGDSTYPYSSAEFLRDCYGPTWGRHKNRTWPTLGNHDYINGTAAAYFDYFGSRAGPRDRGYYTYSVGSWRIYALNSELAGAELVQQQEWLRRALSVNPECSLAIWHRPLFTSGQNGENPHMRETWRLLHKAHVEIVINGHDHLYERFALQDPDGVPDARGIRQFTVGTGGAVPYTPLAARPNSEVLFSAWGVLVLRLGDETYEWEFVPADISPTSSHDHGSGVCS
jgi:hypothetical protein